MGQLSIPVDPRKGFAEGFKIASVIVSVQLSNRVTITYRARATAAARIVNTRPLPRGPKRQAAGARCACLEP